MTKRFNINRILTAGPLSVLVVLLLSAPSNRAENPPARRHHMENRFLFVIDTASAMKPRTNGIEQAVAGLITTGMKDELRKGDTIGLWTYSDTLSTDFPMQVWSEAKAGDIINNVREHLGILVYEKRAHLDNAWTAIHQVVTSSERVTIILIFDGGELIKGTSLDKDINPQIKKLAREFRAAHQPFVLVMAAHDGEITDYTINYPDSIVVPHTADPVPATPETNAPLVAVAPLPPENTNPPPARVVINLTGADFPHHTYSMPRATNGIVADSTSAASNVVAETTPAPPPAPAVVANAQAPVQPAPVAAQTAQTVPTVNAKAAPAEAAPAPPPAASASPPAPATTVPAKLVPSEAPAPSPPAPLAPAAAAVIAPPAASMQVAMMVIAFSLLTIAVALVVLVVWRGRGRSQPSLISQSLNRPH